jgi:hypothetical protein
MQSSIEYLTLFAAWRTNWRDPFNGVYFESNTEEVWAIFIVTGLAVAGALLWQFLNSRAYGRLPSNSPRGLFRELCRAHGLDRSRRRLLKRLAAVRQVSPAVLVFVQPECFSPVDLPADLDEHAATIAELELRLFGEHDDRDGQLPAPRRPAGDSWLSPLAPGETISAAESAVPRGG